MGANAPSGRPSRHGKAKADLRRYGPAAGALAATVLLSQSGLPMDRLAVAGLGSSQPVAANSTAEGKAKNRRVEIFVIEDAAAAAGG